MRKYWLITNLHNLSPEFNSPAFTGTNFKIYAKREAVRIFSRDGSDIIIIVDGYIMPVESVFQEYKNHHREELVFSLYSKYGNDFIHYIKGNFSILIAEKDKFCISNDHLGIRKIFYAPGQNFLLLTNHFNYAAKLVSLTPSHEHIAIHSLLHHFVAGITYSKEIFYSEQGTIFEYFSSPGLKKRNYWNLSNLVNSTDDKITIIDLLDYFRRNILNYFEYFNPEKICLTLTGGMDSRLILAILLYHNIKPGTFAYGNPGSGDVIIARRISEIFGLDFLNHHEEKPDSEWFEKLCDEILKSGDSLTHFHRAFRLAGMKSELSARPETDLIIGGFMGGEGIKGVHYDDLIITRFIRTYNPSLKNKESLISGYLDGYFFKSQDLSYDYIINFIDRLPWYGKDKKANEFFLNFTLNASNHLAQDINFYHYYFPVLFNPYMDIDYLRLLFRSPFSMLQKENTSANPFRRLNIPYYHCNAIRLFSEKLAAIPLSSGFSPNDYLFSKYFYAFKRAFHKKGFNKYLPHFTYGSWYLDFIRDEFDKIHSPTHQFFDLDLASRQLSSDSSGLLSDPTGTEEKYWHRFTNIVMINKIIDFYKN